MRFSLEDGDNFIRNMVTIRHGRHGAMTSPPARKLTRIDTLPIATADLIEDLRLDSDEEVATLERMERGAADFLERRTGYVVIPGTYQVDLDGWWIEDLEVMRGPIRELADVEYLVDATTWTGVDTANFWVDEGDRDFRIRPLRSWTRPALWSEVNRVRLTFDAGFKLDDEAGADEVQPMPDGLRTTLTMLVGHYYQNRELFAAGKIADVEMSAGHLLAAYRQFW